VSTSDPQARVRHHSDGGLTLSYNAQISTAASHGLIVGVAVTQEADDRAQLLPAVDRVEERLKKKPQQMVADGGYTTRDNRDARSAAPRLHERSSLRNASGREWPASHLLPP